MNYEVTAWINLLVRWWHVFSAILWIGQTYLFNRLERNLKRDPNAPENELGGLWMVHGGGFFTLDKKKFPAQMPEDLLWFKWASGSTWLSGMVLLGLSYYMGGLLVEMDASYALGAGVGLGVILAGWFVYDWLVESPLGNNEIVFGAIGYGLIILLAYWLPDAMSSRSAYMHVAAVLGTIMAANVWMRILPAMRRIIARRAVGEEADERDLLMGPRRSKHNSYIVSPLILIMISNHYPVISYGNSYGYLVIGIWLFLGWVFAKIMKG